VEQISEIAMPETIAFCINPKDKMSKIISHQ